MKSREREKNLFFPDRIKIHKKENENKKEREKDTVLFSDFGRQQQSCQGLASAGTERTILGGPCRGMRSHG